MQQAEATAKPPLWTQLLQAFLLWIMLMGAWVLFSQEFAPIALGMGALLCVGASAFAYPLFYEQTGPRHGKIFFRFDLLLVYFLYVVYQSYWSSFTLIWLMLTKRYTPGVIRIRTRLRSRVGRTMLANTISLVPGTLSLWVDGSFIYVHWFDRKSRHRIEAARMIKAPIEKLLSKLFG